MKITIVQAEIEEAIRQFIGGKLQVAQGMAMTIELAATRGEAGMTATIDVHPASDIADEPKASDKASHPATKLVAPAKVTLAPPPVLRSVETAAKPIEQIDDNSNDAEQMKSAEGEGEGSNEEGEKQPAEEGSESAAPAAASSGNRSLFKSLAKPKNN